MLRGPEPQGRTRTLADWGCGAGAGGSILAQPLTPPGRHDGLPLSTCSATFLEATPPDSLV